MDDVYERFKDCLLTLNFVWLDHKAFSDAVFVKGAALDNCWVFIDGTVCPIARPSRSQAVMFSGHKRVHCSKFQVSCYNAVLSNTVIFHYCYFFPIQSLVTPNGLIAHLFGPIEGRRHDAFMLRESGLSQLLCQFNQPNGQPFVIYGDPAYGISQNIIAPFRGAQLTPQRHAFNKSMSQVRISVEWSFCKISQYFYFR